jgi:hypothetical protein
MPLRQPPAEQPFSLIPPNWNPVSNDRVLPHLGLINSALRFESFLELVNHFASPVSSGVPRPINVKDHSPSSSQYDGFCHFDCDDFCRFTPILRYCPLTFSDFLEHLNLFFERKPIASRNSRFTYMTCLRSQPELFIC